jgi:hypothetical protein
MSVLSKVLICSSIKQINPFITNFQPILAKVKIRKGQVQFDFLKQIVQKTGKYDDNTSTPDKEIANYNYPNSII